MTADRGFEHEHNLKSLPFGIVIVHVTRNKIVFYRPLFPHLLDAVATIRAGTSSLAMEHPGRIFIAGPNRNSPLLPSAG